MHLYSQSTFYYIPCTAAEATHSLHYVHTPPHTTSRHTTHMPGLPTPSPRQHPFTHPCAHNFTTDSVLTDFPPTACTTYRPTFLPTASLFSSPPPSTPFPTLLPSSFSCPVGLPCNNCDCKCQTTFIHSFGVHANGVTAPSPSHCLPPPSPRASLPLMANTPRGLFAEDFNFSYSIARSLNERFCPRFGATIFPSLLFTILLC